MKLTFSLIVFCVGLLLVVVSRDFGILKGIDFSQAGSAAGSFMCSAAIFSVYFDIRGKQEISDFVWKEAKASLEAKEAGISGFLDNASKADLSDEIAGAKSIRCAFSYSSRFLKRYENEISKCLLNGGAVTIVFQDKDSPTIRAMEKIDAWHHEEISVNYTVNREIFKRLQRNGNIKVLFHKGLRAYSCVIIDHAAHISFATNSNGRTNVPRITAQKGGTLFSFADRDMEKAIEQSTIA